MKVLMISGDTSILEEWNAVYTRFKLQQSQVDRLDVFVWPRVHSALAICRTARRSRPDVITAQDPFWRGLVAWWVARRTGARLNLQVHADLAGQCFGKRFLACFLLRRADSIRVVSEKLAAHIRAFAPSARITILPIYLDIARFEAIVPKPHAQKTILWIGRFESEKDPLRAISVLKNVRKEGIDAKLIMLGAGSCVAALRAAAHGLPVEFPGWQDPVPYLEVADVVLSTSRHESWGASIVEALAAGVPVVAPDVGVAREAGAIIADRSELSQKVAEVLQQGTCGTLLLKLPSAEEWAKRWRETLV